MADLESTNQLLEQLEHEEKIFQFDDFSNNTAYLLGSKIIEKALKEEKSILVNIQHNDELLFYTKMNDRTEFNDNWVRRKTNTVKHFNHSSFYVKHYLKSINSDLEAQGLDIEDYAAEGGSFPLIIKGQGNVGTITVSGLTGEEDHKMVTSVLKDFLK